MYKRLTGERIFATLNVLFMISLATATLYPFLHILAGSLSDGLIASAGGVTIIPVKFTLVNYRAVFLNHDIFSAFRFSVLRTIVGTAIQLSVTALAAYAIAQKRLPFRTGIIMFLFIPALFSGGLIPTYMVYRALGLMNSFWVYILPGMFGFFNMVVLRTYFETLPVELSEAARMDGAKDPQILGRIVLPLSKPVIATVCLFLAVYHWNDWFTTLLFAFSQKRLWTLQYILQLILQEASAAEQMANAMMQSGRMSPSQSVSRITPRVIQYATLMVATIPIIIVYPFLQKHFAKGVLIGAIKS